MWVLYVWLLIMPPNGNNRIVGPSGMDEYSTREECVDAGRANAVKVNKSSDLFLYWECRESGKLD